jgi:surfactin synthase thioesterase subunit
MQLFCLPYAGGSAAAFHRWTPALPRDVRMHAIELPGHGVRHAEQPITVMFRLVHWIVEEIARHHDGGPYAIFGHSLGALAAFDVARVARRRLGEPAHLYVSGHNGPSVPPDYPMIHHLPDEELAAEVQHLGGLPPEIAGFPELRSRLLRVLRIDLRLAHAYLPFVDAPLECPITVFGGEDDPLVTPAGRRAWAKETTAQTSVVVVPGRHFFLHSESFGRTFGRYLRQHLAEIDVVVQHRPAPRVPMAAAAAAA